MTSDLPPGWFKLRLADIADLQLGKMLDKAKNVAGRSMPYLRNVNVRWGTIETDDLYTMRFTPDEGERFSIRDGDLLVCEGGEPGRCAIWTGGTTDIKFQKALHRIRPSKRVMSEWIALFLRYEALQGGLTDHFTGTTIRHLPAQALAALLPPVPPLAEQRRIVARIEALFARTRRARADLERIAPLSARHRGTILAREYEREQAASPARHQHVPLAECVQDFTYGTAAKCARDADGFPVLRIPNVAAGRVSLDDMKFAALSERDRQKLALKVGDILIVRSNGSPELVGRPALVERPAAGMAFAGYLIRARPRRERVEPAYLLHMLSSPTVRATVELNARSSSGVHNINAAELAALRVPLPPLEEQKLSVRRIEQAAAHALVWESDAARALALLDRLEQSILARAFRGELVPQGSGQEAGPIEHDPMPKSATFRSKRLRRGPLTLATT